MNTDNNDFPTDIPFLKLLGMRHLKVTDGEGVAELALKAEHMNNWEIAHGGMTMTMLNIAMAMADRPTDMHGHGVMTIKMKTAFTQPGYGTLKVSTHCVYQSTTMAFCESEVRDTDGKLVTYDSDAFKFVERMPSPHTPEPGTDG